MQDELSLLSIQASFGSLKPEPSISNETRSSRLGQPHSAPEPEKSAMISSWEGRVRFDHRGRCSSDGLQAMKY